MVLTIGSAEVIGQARGEFALEAGRKRRVGHRGAEIRGKAAGKELAVAEALSSGRIGERNRGGNEARIGIAVEEGRRAAAPAIVADGVEFNLTRQFDVAIDEVATTPGVERKSDVKG